LSHDERRKHPRFKIRAEAQLQCGRERFAGQVKDICRDAVLLEVERELAMGDEVALHLSLPGTSGPLQVVGRVVRTATGEGGRPEAAVLFADLTPAAETLVDVFLNTLES
jgi:hypothetical protein